MPSLAIMRSSVVSLVPPSDGMPMRSPTRSCGVFIGLPLSDTSFSVERRPVNDDRLDRRAAVGDRDDGLEPADPREQRGAAQDRLDRGRRAAGGVDLDRQALLLEVAVDVRDVLRRVAQLRRQDVDDLDLAAAVTAAARRLLGGRRAAASGGVVRVVAAGGQQHAGAAHCGERARGPARRTTCASSATARAPVARRRSCRCLVPSPPSSPARALAGTAPLAHVPLSTAPHPEAAPPVP